MKRARRGLAAATVLGAVGFGLLPAAATGAPAHPSARPGHPGPAACREEFGGNCVTPAQLQTAYGLKKLLASHDDGRGETIAIVDPFGSPTLRQDLHHFDRAFALPEPRLIIDHPEGRNPARHRQSASRLGWALETTLDVDWAHAMAPGATIRLLVTPKDETEGVAGFPDIMRAERWVIRHHRPAVISQSFGATEQTFPDHRAIRRLRFAFTLAKARHVTVLAASGDSGATDLTSSMQSNYHHRVQSWPSADPLVTSIGGLHLSLSAAGQRQAPDRVWDDSYGAGGGGRSVVFGRPSWQDPVKQHVRAARGVPDLSMDADVNGGALVWTSYPGNGRGWNLVGGTSLATPLFAGVVAIADQVAGHRLGLLDPAIYRLASHGAAARAKAGIIDVTRGHNSFGGVPGWTASKGYDLASGWGSVDAGTFIPALVAATR